MNNLLQAITVRAYGASNHRQARLKAQCAAKTIWVSRDYAKDDCGNALAAARELAEVLDWQGQYHGGVIKDGTYVFVVVAGDRHFSV